MERKDLDSKESNELPLAPQESQPPLVIDLPDGQKLLVGDLDPGTVIEIATWRGVGRPDSRTNRLMLGVSTNEAEGIPEKRSLPKIDNVNTAQNQVQDSDIQSFTLTEGRNLRPNDDSRVVSNQTSAGIVYANVNANNKGKHFANKGVSLKLTLSKKKILSWGLTTVIIGALTFVILGPLELRFAHPVAGISTSLGDASSSIAIVKSKVEYELGDIVISDLPQNQPAPIMAIVESVGDSDILLSTESDKFQVRIEQLHGKVIAVFPFIGHIANWLSK